jgi:hypothetical protein
MEYMYFEGDRMFDLAVVLSCKLRSGLSSDEDFGLLERLLARGSQELAFEKRGVGV